MKHPRDQIAAAGMCVERGAYIDTSDDRADRWYLYLPNRDVIDRRGPGHRTLAEAADAATDAAAEAAFAIETDAQD